MRSIKNYKSEKYDDEKDDKSNIKYYIIFIVMFILYDVFRWDIRLHFDSFGSDLFLGLILILFMFVNLILILINIISFFYYLIKDKSECKTIILKLLILCSLIFYYILANTTFFIKLNFYIYENERMEVINIYKNGELERFDEYKYISPNRLISYGKVIYFEEDEDSFKAIFTLMSSAKIIYVDNDELPTDKTLNQGVYNFDVDSLQKNR